jgi:hypothetical protein
MGTYCTGTQEDGLQDGDGVQQWRIGTKGGWRTWFKKGEGDCRMDRG